MILNSQIHKNYGDKYLQLRKYKNKNESAQEAHEAIRPTYMQNNSVDDAETKRLYELIWKRTIASQMADAELEKTTAKINIRQIKHELTARGEVLKFDGFLKVYIEGKDDDDESEENDESRLPHLTVGQSLDLNEMTATEKFTRHAATLYRSLACKKIRRTRYWKAEHLCSYNLNYYQKKLC